MIVKLLTEHHFEFLIIKGAESTRVKMPHCWKYQALAHFYLIKWLDLNMLNEALELLEHKIKEFRSTLPLFS